MCNMLFNFWICDNLCRVQTCRCRRRVIPTRQSQWVSWRYSRMGNLRARRHLSTHWICHIRSVLIVAEIFFKCFGPLIAKWNICILFPYNIILIAFICERNYQKVILRCWNVLVSLICVASSERHLEKNRNSPHEMSGLLWHNQHNDKRLQNHFPSYYCTYITKTVSGHLLSPFLIFLVCHLSHTPRQTWNNSMFNFALLYHLAHVSCYKGEAARIENWIVSTTSIISIIICVSHSGAERRCCGWCLCFRFVTIQDALPHGPAVARSEQLHRYGIQERHRDIRIQERHPLQLSDSKFLKKKM